MAGRSSLVDYLLVLFSFLLNIANFLCYLLQRILIIGILCLKIYEGSDIRPRRNNVEGLLTLLLLSRHLLL